MIMVIAISCMGLLGLVSFANKQRIKEIGVRKVLGATIGNILFMLSKNFVRLVIIPFILVGPLAYLCAQKFLNGYAFRIDIGWQVFVYTGLLSTAMALATVSYHAFRVANTNPTYSLRVE